MTLSKFTRAGGGVFITLCAMVFALHLFADPRHIDPRSFLEHIRYLMCSRKLRGSICRGSANRCRAKTIAHRVMKTPPPARVNLDSVIAKHLVNHHAIPAGERRLVGTLEPRGSNHHRPRTHGRFRPVIAIER